ncbi:MAG: TolC family protein [Bacteroidota bacterium]|nr:TolC family protein [Bacteroidota bacterium]
MKIKYLVSGLFIFFISGATFAQRQTMRLTLDQVIDIAQKQSPDALQAKNRYLGSYWQYRSFKAGFMPGVSLSATLPRYSKSIQPVTQENGTVKFIPLQQTTSSLGLSATQNLSFTGGQLFMTSDLQRLDIKQVNSSTNYATNPVTFGIRQPLFKFNDFKWQRNIQPLYYQEAERRLVEDREQIALTAVSMFFDLLSTQISMKIQLTNLANNDTLYKIAKGRFNIGTLAENDLLQLELQLLSAQSQVENVKLDLENKIFSLKSYLRLQDDVAIELIPPTTTSSMKIESDKAIEQSEENRSGYLDFKRRLLEAQENVLKARANSGFSANLVALYGTTQSAPELANAYQNPRDLQQLTVSLQIPILDWGQAKGRVKVAESNQAMEKSSVEQGIIDFKQEVYLKVMQFNNQRSQVQIAAKTDTVAEKRYEVTKQRYMIGKIAITDLNIAQSEKDNARRGYFDALRTYWRNYFEIRKLTLFDFTKNEKIIVDPLEMRQLN